MEQTETFIKALFGKYFTEGCVGYIEFRVIKDKTENSPSECVERIFCESIIKATSSTILNRLKHFNDQGLSIYYGVLPRGRRSGQEFDVEWITTLWADLDAKDYPGGKNEAWQTALSFLIQPSIVIDSGHGFHMYWLLHPEKITDVTKVKGIIKGVGGTMGADSVYDLGRILRLPGFYNQKHPEEYSVCKIVQGYFHPEKKYTLSDFKKYEIKVAVKINDVEIDHIPEEVPDRFRKLLIKNKKISDVWFGRAIMPNNTTRSAYDMSLAVQLKNHYFSNSEIAAILRHSPSGKGREATQKYLEHTIGKAVLW